MRMLPAEYEGWQDHLARYPPAEFILSAIWLLLARALGVKSAVPEDMGDWLEPPQVRRQLRAEQERVHQVAMTAFISAAYERKKVEL